MFEGYSRGQERNARGRDMQRSDSHERVRQRVGHTMGWGAAFMKVAEVYEELLDGIGNKKCNAFMKNLTGRIRIHYLPTAHLRNIHYCIMCTD